MSNNEITTSDANVEPVPPKKPAAVKKTVKKKVAATTKGKAESKPKTEDTTVVTTSDSVNDVVATEVTDVPEVPVKKKRTVNYLNNKDILKQVKLSKEEGRMNNELAKMLMLLTQRYASRGNFAGYSYNDDMQSFALTSLCKTWATFDAERGTNPFAYYTQCIKNSFKMFLGAEKRQRNIRDALLVSNGMTPSHTYQIENGMSPIDESASFQFEPISTANMYESVED